MTATCEVAKRNAGKMLSQEQKRPKTRWTHVTVTPGYGVVVRMSTEIGTPRSCCNESPPWFYFISQQI